MQIISTRTYAADDTGHPVSREFADLVEHETPADEITRRMAAGEQFRFFNLPRDVLTDGAGRTPSSAATPRDELIDAQRKFADVLYASHASQTGVPQRQRPVPVEQDREYAAYAGACGIQSPATVRLAAQTGRQS